MKALLLLELRRQRAVATRMALLTIAIGLVFYLAGKRTPGDMLAILIGSSLGTVLIVPMGISRDKMEGTLEFICGLPVEAREIAYSRFAAMALVALPWAVGVGLLSPFVPSFGVVQPAALAITIWLVLVMLGSCAIALMTCFDLESVLGVPLISGVILLVLVPRASRALFPELTADAFLRFAGRPEAPAILMGGLLVALAAIGAAALKVTERGFAGYRPNTASR
jgi:hypothetical protein